jgi:hypothetical protein
MDFIRRLHEKEMYADAYGYASWLLTVQLLKELLAKGKIESDHIKKMIEDAYELAFTNPIASPERVAAILQITCEILGVPHDFPDLDELEESDEET